MAIIDTHTHLASPKWLDLLSAHGAPRYAVKPIADGKRAIFADGQVFALLHPDLFDRDKRIADMDAAGVDLSIVSLTTPGVIWGDGAAAAEAARVSNDCLADAQDAHPDRLRWMATLPMHHPEAAAAELSRAIENGAVGVLLSANIDSVPLTDARFEPVWSALDRAALPVTIHPTLPPGASGMTMQDYHLTAMVGFTFDTTLAVARMIFDGFFDRYPGIRFIVTHSGGTAPYIASRLDNGYRILPHCSEHIDSAPTEYLSRLYYDDAMARIDAAKLCMGICGTANYVHGSDYPFIPLDRSVQWAADLDADTRRAVMEDNPKRLFAL